MKSVKDPLNRFNPDKTRNSQCQVKALLREQRSGHQLTINII